MQRHHQRAEDHQLPVAGIQRGQQHQEQEYRRNGDAHCRQAQAAIGTLALPAIGEQSAQYWTGQADDGDQAHHQAGLVLSYVVGAHQQRREPGAHRDLQHRIHAQPSVEPAQGRDLPQLPEAGQQRIVDEVRAIGRLQFVVLHEEGKDAEHEAGNGEDDERRAPTAVVGREITTANDAEDDAHGDEHVEDAELLASLLGGIRGRHQRGAAGCEAGFTDADAETCNGQ